MPTVLRVSNRIRRGAASSPARPSPQRRASAAALAAVLAASAGQPAAAQTIDDPIAEARAEIEATCLSVQYPEDFARMVDLNADGRDDLVITYAVTCDGYHSVFCGRDGCDGGVFIARVEGGYFQAPLPTTVEPTQWNGLPAVVARHGGPECRRAGCEVIRVWDGRRFAPPSYALAERAREGEVSDAGPRFGDEDLAALAEQAAAQLDGLTSAADGLITVRPPRFDGVRIEGGPEDETLDDAEPEGALVIDPAPLPPLEAEAEELIGAGAQRDRWFLSRVLRPGRLSAAVLGEDGRSTLMVSCAPGDRAVEVALLPTEGAALRLPIADGAGAAFDVTTGPSVIDTRRALHLGAEGLWLSEAPARGPLMTGLRNGVEAAFFVQGPGYEAARFTLDGSNRALDVMLDVCSL